MQQTRQRSPIPRRAHATQPVAQVEQDEQEERYTHPLPEQKNQHWFTPFAIGSLIVIFLYIVLIAYVVPFFTNLYNQWHYGDARISSLDATINGRHDHFIAEVLHGRVLVIDFRNSDPSKALVFVSPEPATSDKDQVTLQVADVNGDGKTDIVVHVDGIDVDAILYATHDTFQWTVPQKG